MGLRQKKLNDCHMSHNEQAHTGAGFESKNIWIQDYCAWELHTHMHIYVCMLEWSLACLNLTNLVYLNIILPLILLFPNSSHIILGSMNLSEGNFCTVIPTTGQSELLFTFSILSIPYRLCVHSICGIFDIVFLMSVLPPAFTESLQIHFWHASFVGNKLG